MSNANGGRERERERGTHLVFLRDPDYASDGEGNLQNHEYRLDDEHGERVLAHDLKVEVFQGKQDDDCDTSNQAQRSKDDDTFAGRKGGARVLRLERERAGRVVKREGPSLPIGRGTQQQHLGCLAGLT